MAHVLDNKRRERLDSIFDCSAAASVPHSVVVVFALVTHRQDGDRGCVFDLEQGHVPAVSERDQQLA